MTSWSRVIVSVSFAIRVLRGHVRLGAGMRETNELAYRSSHTRCLRADPAPSPLPRHPAGGASGGRPASSRGPRPGSRRGSLRRQQPSGLSWRSESESTQCHICSRPTRSLGRRFRHAQAKDPSTSRGVSHPNGARHANRRGLWARKESENLAHQPLSLISLENKLSVCRTFENHQLFWVRGFFVLRTNVS